MMQLLAMLFIINGNTLNSIFNIGFILEHEPVTEFLRVRGASLLTVPHNFTQHLCKSL